MLSSSMPKKKRKIAEVETVLSRLSDDLKDPVFRKALREFIRLTSKPRTV